MNNKYLTYDVIQLAEDDVFIAWVREGKNELKWRRFLEDHPDEQRKIDAARRLVETLDFTIPSMDAQLKKDLWQKIDTATPARKESKVRRLYVISTFTAAAAMILLVIYFIGGGSQMRVSTGIGGQELVTLPDQSIIKLNAVSSLSFNKEDFKRERHVYLDGEAFFQVEKGSAFSVILDNGTVDVLGTSFNIFSRNDSVAVFCYTGKVRVSNGKGGKVVLDPGESAFYLDTESGLEKQPFELDYKEPAWTSGVFRFENKPLGLVLDELERQFDIKITVSDASVSLHAGYTGSFERDNTVEEALRAITYPMNLNFAIDGKEVKISQ